MLKMVLIGEALRFASIPVAIMIAVILFFVLYRTKYGMNLHAVGQKREAARLAGINVNKTVINYCLCDQWCSLWTCR